jgi:hypothetical protein
VITTDERLLCKHETSFSVTFCQGLENTTVDNLPILLSKESSEIVCIVQSYRVTFLQKCVFNALAINNGNYLKRGGKKREENRHEATYFIDILHKQTNINLKGH